MTYLTIKICNLLSLGYYYFALVRNKTLEMHIHILHAVEMHIHILHAVEIYIQILHKAAFARIQRALFLSKNEEPPGGTYRRCWSVREVEMS